MSVYTFKGSYKSVVFFLLLRSRFPRLVPWPLLLTRGPPVVLHWVFFSVRSLVGGTRTKSGGGSV